MSQVESVHARQAGVADLTTLAPLFDAYRVFYGKSGDIALAHAFLAERLQHNQSTIFIAEKIQTAVGFTQLYPSFSSVSAARTFILNDLFVVPDMRRSGVAVQLLQAAAAYARTAGAVRLSLSTAVDNEAAQALYASQGWVRDTRFRAYNLAL